MLPLDCVVDLSKGKERAIFFLVHSDDQDKCGVLIVQEACIDDLFILWHVILCHDFKLLAWDDISFAERASLLLFLELLDTTASTLSNIHL